MRKSSTGKLYSTKWRPSTTRNRRWRLLNQIRITDGYDPVLPDLAGWAGLSYNAAWRHVGRLERAGLIEVEGRGCRTPLKIRLVK